MACSCAEILAWGQKNGPFPGETHKKVAHGQKNRLYHARALKKSLRGQENGHFPGEALRETPQLTGTKPSARRSAQKNTARAGKKRTAAVAALICYS